MDKQSAKINIGGMDYTIKGYETQEYMQKVAAYVDGKLSEVKQNCFTLDKSTIAVLTAVNIASDNFKLLEHLHEMEKEIEQLQAQAENTGKKKNR